MAARGSLDDKLAALKALKGRDLSEADRAEVRKRLGDKSNLIVAVAAELAGVNGMHEAGPDLIKAFDRFVEDGSKTDKMCRAKTAVMQALERLEHRDSVFYLKASRYVQFEPVWGGQEDTAIQVRSIALVMLPLVIGSEALGYLVDAFTDPAKDVRSAVAVALGAVGNEAASLLLRLKVRLGDKEPDVLSECLSALLRIQPSEFLPFVCSYLKPLHAAECEAAAMALARSRLVEAFDPLAECYGRCMTNELRQQILLAIAILRQRPGIEFLLELLASGDVTEAGQCLAALQVYQADPKVRESVEERLRARKNPRLDALWQRQLRD